MPAPIDFGTFPVKLAWHVRYRHHPAHRWLRALIAEVTREGGGIRGNVASTEDGLRFFSKKLTLIPSGLMPAGDRELRCIPLA